MEQLHKKHIKEITNVFNRKIEEIKSSSITDRKRRVINALKTEYRAYDKLGISQNDLTDIIITSRKLRDIEQHSETTKKISELLNLKNDTIQQEIEGLSIMNQIFT